MAGQTEWEDALIKHGIVQAPPKVISEEDQHEALREAAEDLDPYASMSLRQLHEHEDDIEEDTLEAYRKKRLAELKEQQRLSRFGSLYAVGQTEYKQAVTDASRESHVVVHLMENGSEACSLLNRCLEDVARRFPIVKFVKIVAQEAIPNFPRDRCPTVLVYKDGNIVSQFVQMSVWAGLKTTPDVVEWVLARSVKGMLKSGLDRDPREELLKTKVHFGGRRAPANDDGDDDDEDW